MRFSHDLIYTGNQTFTKRDTGVSFVLYRFLDPEQGNTFDVTAIDSFNFPSTLEVMKPVVATLQLKCSEKGKYLNLVDLKPSKQ